MTVKSDFNKKDRIRFPKAYEAFQRSHNLDDPEIEDKEWQYWMGYVVADNAAGHFSQDEINFVKAQTTGSEDYDVWKRIIQEMEKSKRG